MQQQTCRHEVSHLSLGSPFFITSSHQAEDTGEDDIIEYIKPSHISGREHLASETAATFKPPGISIYGGTFTDRHALYKPFTITLHSLHRVTLSYCKSAFVHCPVTNTDNIDLLTSLVSKYNIF